MARICGPSARSSSRSSGGMRMSKPPRRERRTRLPIMFHGGPQAVLVQAEDVELRLLAGPARHHRLALLVDVEHELGGLLQAVAEQLLEDEGDVGHQVDRVVPDDHDPGPVGRDDVLDVRLFDLDGRRGHREERATVHGSRVPPSPSGPVPATGTEKARWNCRTATQTAAAPAMWKPTSRAGTPVKYCT